MLTLPLCGFIKSIHKDVEIIFLGKKYTKPLIDACCWIDTFVDWESIENNAVTELKALNADTILHVFPTKTIAQAASRANIKQRIGTSHRWYNWLYCNKLINLGRKNSALHEAQLNIALITNSLGLKDKIIPLENIPQYYGFERVTELAPPLKNLLNLNKFNLIIHPKSKGSAPEWGLENYNQLINSLNLNHFQLFITGTKEEGLIIQQQQPQLFDNQNITNLTGQLNLEQLIRFIKNADGILAGSTGPLHIAAALGKKTLGLYVPRKPFHPTRWKPIGNQAEYLCFNGTCKGCKSKKICQCIQQINVLEVKRKIESWI